MINELETLTLKSVVLKDPEYFYRRVCRYYSEKFHTPLLSVYELPWPFVFQNYLEHIIETNNTQEDLYRLAIDICYPEKAYTEEQEISDWHKKIEEEEQARLLRESPHILEQEVVSENPHIDEEEIHMGEGTFTHLDDEMEEDD